MQKLEQQNEQLRSLLLEQRRNGNGLLRGSTAAYRDEKYLGDGGYGSSSPSPEYPYLSNNTNNNNNRALVIGADSDDAYLSESSSHARVHALLQRQSELQRRAEQHRVLLSAAQRELRELAVRRSHSAGREFDQRGRKAPLLSQAMQAEAEAAQRAAQTQAELRSVASELSRLGISTPPAAQYGSSNSSSNSMKGFNSGGGGLRVFRSSDGRRANQPAPARLQPLSLSTSSSSSSLLPPPPSSSSPPRYPFAHSLSGSLSAAQSEENSLFPLQRAQLPPPRVAQRRGVPLHTRRAMDPDSDALLRKFYST